MERFVYEGPVFQFGNLVSNKWKSQTLAVSDKKAYSNLVYQYKKKNNLAPSSKITLEREKIRKDG